MQSRAYKQHLVEELEGEGQFTVFAPTDKAMEALEPALKRMLEEGKEGADVSQLPAFH